MMLRQRKTYGFIAAALLITALLGSVAFAGKTTEKTGKSGFKVKGKLGGPASVEAQLEEGDMEKKPALRMPWFDEHLQPWFDFKGQLNKDYGLQIGVAYTALYQMASDAPAGAEDEAASGIFRVFGKWEMVGRDTENTGTLVFSGDNRHRLGTDIPPADLGFSVGYLGIPGTLFSDVGTVLVDLNWQQSLNERRSGIIIGRYDPNDYLDILGYANPWTAFQNLSILLNTSIALPDASVGVGGGHFLTDQVFVLGTLNDANGVVNDVDFFDDGYEFYKAAEIGWTPARGQRYFKNVHLMGWHVDERDNAGIPDSWGITAGANWTVDNTWMTFVKAGWSEGEAPLMNTSITVGALYYVARRSDLIGLGLNWGNPSDSSLREQYTGEFFYRLQLAQNLAITPSVQLIIDPALNPAEDKIWLYGLRMRLTF